MNFFKKDPKSFFQLTAAIITVVLAYYLVLFFVTPGMKTADQDVPVIPPSVEKKEQDSVDYDKFGPIHVEVDSPSYARSNFDINPRTSVTIYFNAEVDLEDVVSKFSLVNEATNTEMPVRVSSKVRSGDDDWEEYNWKWQEVWQEKVIFSPNIELEPITMYRAEIKPGFLDKTGTYGALQGMIFEFLTADKPGVLSSNLKEENQLISLDEVIKIIFKSPMDKAELENWLIISPDMILSLKVHDKILTITNDFTLGAYTLTIPAGSKDIYGREISEDVTYTFTVVR